MEIFYIYSITSYISCGLSVGLNGMLIYLTLKNTSKDLKSYRHVLFQTSTMDLFFAFIAVMTIPQAETSGIYIFFRMGTSWFPSTGFFPCLGIWFYMFSLFTVLWSMIIQGAFRYYTIINRHTLSTPTIWLFQFCIFIVAMIISTPYLIVPCSNLDLKIIDQLVDMDLWGLHKDLKPTFRYVNYRSIGFSIYLYCSFIFSVAINLFFLLINLRVTKTLNSNKSHFSPQTIKIHRQFGKRMILQSLMPIISLACFAAVFIVVYSVPPEYADIHGGYILYALAPLPYIVVLNPLITLLSIQSYRKALLCKNMGETPIQSIQKSTSFKTASTIIPSGNANRRDTHLKN